MKIMKRSLCIVLTVSLLMSMFVFAPGVFAETDGQASGAQVQLAETTDLQNKGTGDSQIYTISIAQVAGGTVTVDKTSATQGETVTYTVTPDSGYKTGSIKLNEVPEIVTAPYTITTGKFKVQSDVSISAVFTKIGTYKITTSATTGGSITASANVTENESVIINAKPNTGYYLADLQVDGTSQGAKATYDFKNVTKAHTVKAIFKKKVKVMLDAGHYGNMNRSPVFSSYYESNMAWQLHLYLKEELEKYNGFSIGTTRVSKDRDMDVYNRGSASKGYDLFLSLHSNSASSATVDYPLVIYQKSNKVKGMVEPLYKAIQKTMGTNSSGRAWSKTNSDGKTEYYGVLRGSASVGTPGLILEHSFHTNLKMTKWLSNNSNLRNMAIAEAKAVAEYYKLQLKDGEIVEPEEPEIPEEPEKPQIVSSTQKVKVLVSDLNMRQTYNSSSKSMGFCTKNKIYQLKAKLKDGSWGQLKENGYWIFLNGGYTTTDLTNPEPEPSKVVSSTEKVKVTVGSLAMRKSYSTSSAKMGTCKKNTVYQLKAKTKDGLWGQLKTNGYWIYLKGYTTKVNSASTGKTVSSNEKVKVTVTSLAMRKSYSTSSAKMGTCKKNKVYQLKAKTKDGLWGQLKTNGYWIYLKGYTKKA